MFANIGDLTSNVISSGKNLPLRYVLVLGSKHQYFFLKISFLGLKVELSNQIASTFHNYIIL